MKRIRQGWNTLRRSRLKRCFADRSTLCCRRPDWAFAQYRVFLLHAALAGQPQDRQRTLLSAGAVLAQVLDSELQEYKTIKPEVDTNFAPEGCFYREVNNILAEDTGLGIYDPAPFG